MITICIPSTPERAPRLKKLIESIEAQDYKDIKMNIYIDSDYIGWVAAQHKALEGVDGLIFYAGDDTVLEPDCISTLMDAYTKRFPDGIGCASPYNEFQGADLITAGIIHSDLMRKLLYKGYFHNYADNEMTELIKRLDKHIYVPTAILKHEHVITDPKLQDKTYKVNQDMKDRDAKLYQQRRVNNFKPRNE